MRPECIEEPSLGKSPGEDRLPPGGQSYERRVLLLDEGQVFRAKALEASADLVGGQLDLATERLLLDG